MTPQCPFCKQHDTLWEVGEVSYTQVINELQRTDAGRLISIGDPPEPCDEVLSYHRDAYVCTNCWYETTDLEEFVPGYTGEVG